MECDCGSDDGCPKRLPGIFENDWGWYTSGNDSELESARILTH